jgi:DNA (cytosine-5)-methyltransferase 3A
MKVLSLFNGCGMVRPALAKANIQVTSLHYCEIDKIANKVMHHNYPNDTLISTDVTQFFPKEGDYDLIVAGFPCQNFSVANKNRDSNIGLKLFYEAKRIINTVKPKFFILENVASMKKDISKYISEQLGVEPIMLDAAWFSAQRRKRLFWTNIPNVSIPINKSNATLKDILLDTVDQKYYLSEEQQKKVKWLKSKKELSNGFKEGAVKFPQELDDKSQTICATNPTVARGTTKIGYIEKEYNINCKNYPASQGTLIHSTEGKQMALPSMPMGMNWIKDTTSIRRLTPVEHELLMGLPKDYTLWGDKELKDTNRYKLCGNGFHVDVVAYILKFINK